MKNSQDAKLTKTPQTCTTQKVAPGHYAPHLENMLPLAFCKRGAQGEAS
jgi:hypothetical protein